MPRSGLVRHAEPCHDERQDSADDRTEVYQEGLYHVALCLLRIVEHVGHQRPEGLHRDVERQIHEQQDESPHGERGEDRAPGLAGRDPLGCRKQQGKVGFERLFEALPFIVVAGDPVAQFGAGLAAAKDLLAAQRDRPIEDGQQAAVFL